jgi:hypothetical protein
MPPSAEITTAIVELDKFGQPIAEIVEDCKKTPKETLWQKLKKEASLEPRFGARAASAAAQAHEAVRACSRERVRDDDSTGPTRSAAPG